MTLFTNLKAEQDTSTFLSSSICVPTDYQSHASSTTEQTHAPGNTTNRPTDAAWAEGAPPNVLLAACPSLPRQQRNSSVRSLQEVL